VTNLINLGRVKKQRSRAEKRAKGDQNAVHFGPTKDEAQLISERIVRHNHLLDQHKFDKDE